MLRRMEKSRSDEASAIFFNAKGQIENIFMRAIQSLLQILDIAVVV